MISKYFVFYLYILDRLGRQNHFVMLCSLKTTSLAATCLWSTRIQIRWVNYILHKKYHKRKSYFFFNSIYNFPFSQICSVVLPLRDLSVNWRPTVRVWSHCLVSPLHSPRSVGVGRSTADSLDAVSDYMVKYINKHKEEI